MNLFWIATFLGISIFSWYSNAKSIKDANVTSEAELPTTNGTGVNSGANPRAADENYRNGRYLQSAEIVGKMEMHRRFSLWMY